MGDQWPFADRLELATEIEGVWHAIVITDLRPADEPKFAGQGRAQATVCGIPLGQTTAKEHEVTCDDCLYGGLDGLLREFSEAPRELVTTGPVPA